MLLSRNQREVRPFCEDTACGSLFPSLSLQEGAPHPLEIATRRSRERIVIYQRVSKAWADSKEGALAVGLVI